MKKLAIILFIFSLSFELHANKFSKQVLAQVDFQVEMTQWEEVDKQLPRKSTFLVIDMETGKSFDVQRRAGSNHADVQPLTHKDTKIMKEIYDGKWSWKRRAVLILSNNQLIAASMHGMPHGAGALQNGFPGHFCIHFNGSTTHKTGSPDLSHHLMIKKAGGQLDSYLTELAPVGLVDAFLAGAKNNDQVLFKKTSLNEKADLKILDEIEALRWQTSTVSNEETPFIQEINADLKLFLTDKGPLNTRITFKVVKTSPAAPWKVDGSPLLKLLKN